MHRVKVSTRWWLLVAVFSVSGPVMALTPCDPANAISVDDSCEGALSSLDSESYELNDELTDRPESQPAYHRDLAPAGQGSIADDEIRSGDAIKKTTPANRLSRKSRSKYKKEVRYDAENDRLSFELNGVNRKLCGVSQAQYEALVAMQGQGDYLEALLNKSTHACDPYDK